MDYAQSPAENIQRDALLYEYSILMTSLRVGVSRHLLDEHFTAIWANDCRHERAYFQAD